MVSTNFRATGELFTAVRKLAADGGISLNEALVTLVRLGLRTVEQEFDGDILIARRDLTRSRPTGNDSGERS